MFGRRGRSRRRYRAFSTVRKHVSYLSSGSGTNVIGANTLSTVPIATAADSPDKSIVTDFGGTNFVQVENNSKVRGGFIRLEVTGGVTTGPLVYHIAVYKNPSNNLTAPTDANQFHTGPTTTNNALYRRYLCYYKKCMISQDQMKDIHIIRFAKFPRRNKFLRDNDRYILLIHNTQALTDQVFYHAYGRLITVPG